jgi:hypothetical protein
MRTFGEYISEAMVPAAPALDPDGRSNNPMIDNVAQFLDHPSHSAKAAILKERRRQKAGTLSGGQQQMLVQLSEIEGLILAQAVRGFAHIVQRKGLAMVALK